ncbi:MAG: endo-1,4-beta-xylanase, partial [Acidimicrobiia bacterium]
MITVVTTIIGGPGFRATVSAQGTWGECHPSEPASCTLADLAELLGIRIGTTLVDFEIVDSDDVATLRREFSSVTPENALKAYTIRPTQSSWDFGAGDAVVDYSVDAGLEIRGHTLVWAKDEYTPAWLAGLTDPVALWTATQEHVTQVMSRY